MIDTMFRFKIQSLDMESEDDFKWEKFELQIIDLIESYNFHIKFISIRV
jgi:hypothetical protein